MKLAIKDRVILPGVLAVTKGKKFDFLYKVDAFISQISVGDLEKIAIDWKQDGGNVTWNDSAETEVEFDISIEQIANVCECFRTLESMEPSRVLLEHLPTYTRFMKALESA